MDPNNRYGTAAVAILVALLAGCTDMTVTDLKVSSSTVSSSSLSLHASSDASPSSSSMQVQLSSRAMTDIGAAPIDLPLSVSFPIILNEVQGFLVTGTPDCSTSGVFSMSFVDTSRFQVSSGNMLFWTQGECAANVLTGTGSSLTGATWSFVPRMALAPDAASSYCDTTYPFSKSQIQISFTDTNLTESISILGWCWSSRVIDAEAATSGRKAEGCNIVVDSSQGSPAISSLVSVDLPARLYTTQFSYQGKTCHYTQSLLEVESKSSCDNSYSAWRADGGSAVHGTFNPDYLTSKASTTYEACVAATGWQGSAF